MFTEEAGARVDLCWLTLDTKFILQRLTGCFLPAIYKIFDNWNVLVASIPCWSRLSIPPSKIKVIPAK